MAVYTSVTDDQIDAFLSHYDLGRLVSCQGIKTGVENTNYRLETDSGPSILTIYEKRTKREDLPFFLGLMEHLAQRQIPCPLPVRDKDGQLTRDLAGKPAAIVSFLQGRMPDRISPEMCDDVGAWLARMHVASEGMTLTRENGMSFPAWRDLIGKAGPRADEVKEGFAQLLQDELAFLASAWPKDLPRGVIHADLFQDNVFFDGDRLCGMIDFYFACTDFFAYDLVITLNAWCFEHDVAFNITKARAMLRGYERVRPFTPRERACLPILARGASLRIIATRLYDWLNQPPGALVKPKNPLDYLTRLQFHQQISSLTAYGLDP